MQKFQIIGTRVLAESITRRDDAIVFESLVPGPGDAYEDPPA